MNEFENENPGQGAYSALRKRAFNDYYTYSFISRAPFYSMISSEYRDFMTRFVQNWLWWADGWVPYFHNAEQGIPSTRIGGALCESVARMIVGGHIMYKNAGKDSTLTGVNRPLKFMADWAEKTEFEDAIKDGIEFATQAGTALAKINIAYDTETIGDHEKRLGKLWVSCMRFDSFLPKVAPNGEVVDVECFLRCFTDLDGNSKKEGDGVSAFYVVEHRYFGRFESMDGRTRDNVPMVEYIVKKTSGSITNGEFSAAGNAGRVMFRDLSNTAKKAIGKAYAGIMFDTPSLLPFPDYLGCELVTFTRHVTGLPELPFGESLLAKLISDLESYDYYHAAYNTDMYMGRGRVLLPAFMSKDGGEGFNSGLEGFVFKWQTNEPGDKKPEPIQFDVRAEQWTATRTRIIEDMALKIGINASAIASFLTGNSVRTAREVSSDEDNSAMFINEKRALIEKPFNRILKCICRYYGFDEDVVIRWSGGVLSNRYSLTEIISKALEGHYLSRYKAVQMFNYDDDTEQVEEEYRRILDDIKSETAADFLPEEFGAATDGENESGVMSGDGYGYGDENGAKAADTADGEPPAEPGRADA